MDIRYEPLFHIVMLLYPDLAVRMLAQLHPDMRPRALRFIIKGEKGESNIIEYDEKTGVTPTDEQIQQATLQFEKSLKMSPMSRGVRFDVYFEDDVAIINFEMQRKLEKYIDYRLHLSSSMILAYQTEINAEYKDLKPVYITFLCIEDPYDCGMRKYTWNTVCQEAPGLKQSYAPVWTVYNASGYKGEVGEDIHDLLEYFRDPYKYDISKTKNKLIPDLQEAARKAALDRRTREMLTRSEIWLQSIEANAMLRGEEIGLEKGRVEGRMEGRTEGRMEGRTEGLEEGILIGEEKNLIRSVLHMASKDYSAEIIADALNIPLSKVEIILAK